MDYQNIILVVPASVAGGALGMLAFWNRRPRKDGANKLRQTAVLLTGSVAFVVSLALFAKAFGASSVLYAVTVTMLVGAWTGMVHTVRPLGLPGWFLKVRRREFAVLGRHWTGIPLFGLVLRRTPLRHLGGTVYLARCANDPARVWSGIQDAEAIHVWSVLLCAPWLMFWSLQGWWFLVGSSLAVHALLNVYPVLHLRLTRARMARCSARLAAKSRQSI